MEINNHLGPKVGEYQLNELMFQTSSCVMLYPKVGEYRLNEGQMEIDMNQPHSGIYLLTFSDGTVERVMKN